MAIKKLMTRTFLVGSILAVMLSAAVLVGCGNDTGIGEGRDSGGATATQQISRGDSPGEHGSGGENAGEGGGSGSEEDSGTTLAPDATFDAVRGGARLILNYDAASNAFIGTVANTTNNALNQIRIEVHLSNGTELGPTTPVNLAPGEVVEVHLPATQASFTGWVAHAEVGGGAAGGGMAATASPVGSMAPAVSTVPAASGVRAGRTPKLSQGEFVVCLTVR